MLASLRDDPDVVEALKNPAVAEAYQDVLQNGPSAGLQYITDPTCRPIIEKIMRKLGMGEELEELLELADDEAVAAEGPVETEMVD